MLPLYRRSPRSVAKAPVMRNRYSSSLARACSESSCDVYEFKNAVICQTLYAYVWVATGTGAIGGSTYHCYWLSVIPF